MTLAIMLTAILVPTVAGAFVADQAVYVRRSWLSGLLLAAGIALVLLPWAAGVALAIAEV